MAIFRLSVNIVRRSKGQSVLASAAYRAGERLNDPNRVRDHDYTRRGGIEHTEIMAPRYAPDWVQVLDKRREKDVREILWQRAEDAERRNNSQLAREVLISLPHELDSEQRKQLVRDYVERNFTSRGMVADVALHAPIPGDDPRNFHAHILLTMRDVTADGFGKHKRRDWNDRALLNEWRKDWERTANRHLERAGRPERVDCRSNKARGIDREPQPKLGPIAHEMEKAGRRSLAGDTIRQVKERNLMREIGELGARTLDDIEKTLDNAQHDLAKLHILERLEACLDRLEGAHPTRAALADPLSRTTERAPIKGLSRAADSTLNIFGGVLSFFEPAPAPQQRNPENIDDRIARLEGIRDQLLREDYARAHAAARAQEMAREEDAEIGRRRERDRFK
jgi:hypothetical protein